MKRTLITICPLALIWIMAIATASASAQSGVNRQRAQQGTNPGVRPNKQQRVPPILRGKGKMGPLPGLGIPGTNPARNQRLNQQQFRRQQLMQALALSSDQRLQMAEIRRKHEEDAIVVGRRLRQARQALDRALFSESYNETQVKQLTEELVAAQSEQIRLQARLSSEVRRVMTVEQIRRFREKERELKREQKQRELLNQTDRPPDKEDKEDNDDNGEDEDGLLFWLFK